MHFFGDKATLGMGWLVGFVQMEFFGTYIRLNISGKMIPLRTKFNYSRGLNEIKR